MQLVLRPDHVMFRPEDVDGMVVSLKGHELGRMYLQEVYYAVREEVI